MMIETLWQQMRDRLGDVKGDEPKTPWDLLSSYKKIGTNRSLTGLGPKILCHPIVRGISGEFVALEGAIWIEEGVKIGSFVKLVGPLWIGKGARIGDYASISESYVGRNSLVGEYVTVRRSIIGDETKLYHQSLILDSVIGSNVEIAGQLYTANHVSVQGRERYAYWQGEQHICPEVYGAMIDKNVKCGPWVSIMPGTHVAEGTKTVFPSMISGNGVVRRFETVKDFIPC